MKAHDVRNLRYCNRCHKLGLKRDFLAKGSLCIECAYREAGGLEGFLREYPDMEWEKLTLGLIGVDNMRALVAKIRGKE